MKRQRLLWLGLFVAVVGGTSSLSAACPCLTTFCSCCIDRCRIGFAKVSQDGCRNRGGLERYSVVMRVTPRGTEVRGYQGAVTYAFARSVWENTLPETASAISRGARDQLGYASGLANIQNIADGSWGRTLAGSMLSKNTPWMYFAPLGVDGPPNSPTAHGGIVGQLYVLNLASGELARTLKGAAGLESLGKVGLLDQPGATTREMWVNVINGRQGAGPNPYVSDFTIQANNPDLYSWRSCTDSQTCMLVFVLAVVVAVIAIVTFQYYALYFAGALLASMLAQSLGWYCGLYPCNKKCTFGVIAVSTAYYVRFDTSTGGPGDPGTDYVLNGVALTSRLDMVRDSATGEYRLGSRHVRDVNPRGDGSAVALVAKTTLFDLGDSSIVPESVEDPSRQVDLMIVPPQQPSELLPGVSYGIEKRN